MENNIITIDNIFIEESYANKDEILKALAKKASDLSVSNNEEQTYADLTARENLNSTGLMDSFAIPHAQSESIVSPTILFIRLSDEVEWETMDDTNVKYVISILVPKANEDNLHMKVISKLSRSLMKKDFKKLLSNSQNKTEIYESFLEIFREEA